MLHSCDCGTCLLNSAILVCMRCFHHAILLLFSCLLLFFPNNYVKTFSTTKTNKFVSMIDCMDPTQHFFHLFPIYISKVNSSFYFWFFHFFNYISEYLSGIFIKVILFSLLSIILSTSAAASILIPLSPSEHLTD